MSLRSRPSAGTVLGASALFVALGGTGYALIGSGVPDAAGTFHGCVNRKTGALRVVTAASKCKRKRPAELAVSWSQRGPAGPAGANGASGASGTNGRDGADGAGGTTIVARARSTGPLTTTSSSQPISMTGATWTQPVSDLDRPYARVTYQAPSSSDCSIQFGPSPATPGAMTVTLSIDGVATNSVFVSAGSSETTSTVTMTPLLEPGSPSDHTVSAAAIDSCGQGTGAQTAHFTVQSVAVDVAGVR